MGWQKCIQSETTVNVALLRISSVAFPLGESLLAGVLPGYTYCGFAIVAVRLKGILLVRALLPGATVLRLKSTMNIPAFVRRTGPVSGDE
jgi:hypothetical protein